MVAMHKNNDNLKAIGINSNGDEKQFEIDSNGILYCNKENLISIDIPGGVKYIWCNNNKITKLILPEGIIEINCWDNLLTELNIPKSVTRLYCDRNVKGLYKVDWECVITLY